MRVVSFGALFGASAQFIVLHLLTKILRERHSVSKTIVKTEKRRLKLPPYREAQAPPLTQGVLQVLVHPPAAVIVAVTFGTVAGFRGMRAF